MPQFTHRLTRDMTIRYVAVLATLGLLAIGSFLGLVRVLMDADSGLELVSLAGRQRALLEHSALTAAQLSVAPASDPVRRDLENQVQTTLDQLETAHQSMARGLPGARSTVAPSAGVRALFFGPDGDIDASVAAFVAHGRGVLAGRVGSAGFAADVVWLRDAATGPLAIQLDQLATTYREESHARLRSVFLYHGTVLALELFLLLLSAWMVFRPMVARLRADIAERMESEKNLRESEERLWRLLQESPVGVSASRRRDGVVVFANQRFCEILGANPADVLGRQARDLYVDETQLADVVADLKRNGVINDAEVEFRRFDGAPFWALLTVRGSRFQGEAVNLAWIYDISGLKSAEEKLRLTAKVVESASEAVVITNADNVIEYVNPAFSLITEYTEEEVLGKKPSLWRSGRHEGEFYQAMWADLSAKGRWRGEIWNRRKSGEFYAEWLSIVAIRDEADQVNNYIAIFSDITHRKEDEERVWRQANFDALTGLPNRALFLDRLSQAIRQAKRENQKFALFFIDLDGFKAVNDTLGHAAGDLLLQQTGLRLTDCVRASDTVARLAGDEFTCIVQGVHDHLDATLVAQKVLDRLAQPFDLDGRPAHVRGSVGISIYPDDAADGAELVRLADQAMYRVKRRGKNGFDFAVGH